MGGYQGRPLQAGDAVPTADDAKGTPGRSVPVELRPEVGPSAEIRVVMGMYDHRLTEAGRRAFLETEWTLTPVADRIGFRYRGAELEFVEREQPFGAGSDPSNIVDAPYPIGSIQIPGGVEPIILHRDAVSGGGYAMVATVISSDMDRVGQSAPNTKTRFVEVDLDAALGARKEYKARVGRLRESLS
jgi:allophanate hydrolase subunit 2